MIAASAHDEGAAGVLRWSLVGLAGIGIVGTAAELALERHWDGLEQLIPWAFVGVAVVAFILLVAVPRPAAIWTVRLLALVVLVGVPIGLWRHINANYNAGFLDYRYADTWPTMSAAGRWFRAATKTVGPAPILAPAVLGQVAVCLLAATLRHPSLRARNLEAATTDSGPPATAE